MNNLFTSAEHWANSYGAGLQNKSMLLTPLLEEDKGIESKEKYGTLLFNKEAAHVLRDKLVAEGFVVKSEYKSALEFFKIDLAKDGVEVVLCHEVDKFDECAALKKRLAELGCHY